MDEIFLRIVSAGIVLGAIAVTDWRERAANVETLMIALGIGVCFIAYDIFLTGAFFEYSLWTFLSIGLVAVLCVTLTVLSRKFTFGWADTLFIAAMVMILPPISGIHPALPAVMLGMFGTIVFAVSSSLSKNVMDIINGRPFSRDLFFMHIKRSGEKFAISGNTRRAGEIRDDIQLDSEGNEMYESVSSSGTRVVTAMPLCTMLYLGMVSVLSVMYLTDIDMVQVTKAIYGLVPFPEISWSVGFNP